MSRNIGVGDRVVRREENRYETYWLEVCRRIGVPPDHKFTVMSEHDGYLHLSDGAGDYWKSSLFSLVEEPEFSPMSELETLAYFAESLYPDTPITGKILAGLIRKTYLDV